MIFKTKYITTDEFKAFSGIDLESELQDTANPSDKAEAFLYRIEMRMATFIEVNTYKRVDTEYRRFTNYQKEQYKLALLEQALYVFKNGDISVDSGYDQQDGIIADREKLKTIYLSQNAKDHLISCGLYDRHIRSKRSIEWGTLRYK